MANTSLDPVTVDAEDEELNKESIASSTQAPPTSSASTFAGLPIEQVGDRKSHFKGLIYAAPGMGKTLLAGSAAVVEEMAPLIYIDLEGGTETLKRTYPNIQSVRVKNITDKSGRIKKSAWQQLIEVHAALERGEGGYRTAVIDNLSEGYQISLADVMAEAVAERPDRADPDVPSQREWGKASSQVRRWVRWMRDLDMNVIFTAHEQAHSDDNGNILKYTPALPGKLANEISGFMDFVFYLYTKQEKGEDNKLTVVRKLQTQPVGKYIAKDRTGQLPLILSDPTMAKIYQEVK